MKNFTSLKKMNLISYLIIAINLAVYCKADEHFTFPPHFQTPHPVILSPDRLPLLPPETHTSIPYYQIKNINNLPYPFLPPSGAKVPIGFPTPLPPIMSSTFMVIRNDDDDDNDEDEISTTAFPLHLQNKINRTERYRNQRAARREYRPISQNTQHSIDRIDTKFPFHLSTEQSTQNMPTMTPRSIVVSDLQRNDQMKAANYVNAQYLPQPGLFVSSTTETAIPILRLSNEMDLDGSFSYEALGADQTHYVQHSRMENMGNGKEEQVVEGSYSYVGSDGKTYSVHYIADSNGFRAVGDHLPVAPPVPEIIQRAIQYNLAEEAKRPPNLQSWHDEERENELNESERHHHISVSPPRMNNLFTGKTPESFSHSFGKPSNTQNNLITTASNQTPIQSNVDFTADQIQRKANSGTISPQITFVASQGAHVPSANIPQQTIARAFTTEKSTMPQLINYEANAKDFDQESNKALWRWQYGINSNANQNIDKNAISRSSGDDDIIINFGNMTPEQYTKMIKQELEPSMRKNIDASQQTDNFDHNYDQYDQNDNSGEINDYKYYDQQSSRESTNPNNVSTSTEKSIILSHPQSSHQEYTTYDKKPQSQTDFSQTSRPKLITQQHFIPPSQMVLKSYNYAENDFQTKKSKIMNSDTENISGVKLNVLPIKYNNQIETSLKTETDQFDDRLKTNVILNAPPRNTDTNVNFSDFIVSDNNEDFKPLFQYTEPQTEEATTTEATIEGIFTQNVFLKNLLRNDENINSRIVDSNKNSYNKPVINTKIDHPSKPFQHQSKMYNENKNFKRKPITIAEMVHFMSNNQFESSKLKPNEKQQSMESYKQQTEMNYSFPKDDENDSDDQNKRQLRTIQQNGELRGVIKNYKVLQRNNNIQNIESFDRFKKNTRPLTYNLPPLGRAGPSTKNYLPPVFV